MIANSISLPKAGIQGASLGLLTKFMEPNAKINLPMIGRSVPLYVVSGIAGVSASVLSDIAHSYVLPHIPVLQKYNQQESAILGPLINAGGYIGTYYIANADSLKTLGLPMLAGQAVISDIASTYIASNFFGG